MNETTYETTYATRHPTSANLPGPLALPEPHVLPDRQDRLLDLVGDLIQTNQELRFQVAELEQKSERLARGLEHASAVYGLLLP
jgi:hypothetical protein